MTSVHSASAISSTPTAAVVTAIGRQPKRSPAATTANIPKSRNGLPTSPASQISASATPPSTRCVAERYRGNRIGIATTGRAARIAKTRYPAQIACSNC